MPEYFYVNGRLMQRQPCQQQQGASMMSAPPPQQPTLMAATFRHPACIPPPSLPVSNDATMAWIKRASDQTDLDPYTYLNLARKQVSP
ncbi:MAG: hypothetical protein JWN73_4861 [Betaproteobacteria bacterium]|nr:hypothetical protein [Betaproteobacteria bacterium]